MADTERAARRGDDWSLLVRACRWDTTGLAADVARAFPDRAGADWTGLLALMDAQGVGPLAASVLLSLGPQLLPPDVRAALHERVRLGSLRAGVLVPELTGIIEALEARGVEAIAYKGPALSVLAYGRPGIRDSVDLDLLVREGDVPAAEETLRRRGYRRQSPPELRPRVEAAFRAAANAAEFLSGDEWVFVDLHWRMCPARYPFRLDSARLWSRPERVALGGRQVRVFPRETLLCLLCLHGAKDRWQRLVWLCDVDRVVRASAALDWQEVVRFAEEGRCRRALGLGLLLARRVLETPLPPRLLCSLEEDEKLRRLAATVEDDLVAGGIGRAWWLEHFNLWPFHLDVFDSWSDGARYVGRTLVTPDPEDWPLIKAPLPDALFPLYFQVRPLRKLASLVRLSVQRASRPGRR
jgi:hypothetical protein